MNNFNEFIKAIKINDLAKVKDLFVEEFINKRKDDGLTALHNASMNNNNGDIAEFLLRKGCDIEAETFESGDRPIHLSAKYGKVDVLNVLIKGYCLLDELNKGGKTALDLGKEFFRDKCVEILMGSKSFKKNLQLLANYKLSAIIESQTKTVLDILVCKKDPRIIPIIMSIKVSDEEIKELKMLSLNDPSYKLLHQCLLARCIDQKYENGIYDLCRVDIVNEPSVFLEQSYLETAVMRGVTSYSVENILFKLLQEDDSWRRAEDIAKEKNDERTSDIIASRRNFFKDKQNEGKSRLQIAEYEHKKMIEYITANSKVSKPVEEST